jgi:hypothetical protein
LHSFCAATSTPNISKIDIRIIVDVPTEPGETSLWLARSELPGWDDGTFWGEMALLPGALPTHAQLLALLDAQRKKLLRLKSFSIDVKLNVTDCRGEFRSPTFWSFCFPSFPHELDFIENGSGWEGQDHGTFDVSRDGILGARMFYYHSIELVRELEEEYSAINVDRSQSR